MLAYGPHRREISGFEPRTTNNRMELTAAIEALCALKEPCNVNLYTDSKYVSDSINNGWAQSWQKNGWRKPNKKTAENHDLWEKLLMLINVHNVRFFWVKGHNGNPDNERCDMLAVEAIKNIF